MSASPNNMNKNQTIDEDVKSGAVKLSAINGGHIFDSETPMDVVKKYFTYPSNVVVNGATYTRYNYKKLVNGKLVNIPSVSVSVDNIIIRGPHVPHPNSKTAGGKTYDVGPTKPGINFCINKSMSKLQQIVDYLDVSAKCAYIFEASKFGKAYSNALTFTAESITGTYCISFKDVDTTRNVLRILTVEGNIVPFGSFMKNAPDLPKDAKTPDYASYAPSHDLTVGGEKTSEPVLNAGNQSKLLDPKSKGDLYITCDFVMQKGTKVRKTQSDGGKGTSEEDLKNMAKYEHWKFPVNIAVNKNGKYNRITMGSGGPPINWFVFGSENGRKEPNWKALCTNFPEMENLPLPRVIDSPDVSMAYKGGVVFSISSVGHGNNVSKTHYQVEETYILPEIVPDGNSRIMGGETISITFSNGPQFGLTSNSVEAKNDDTGYDEMANKFQDEGVE